MARSHGNTPQRDDMDKRLSIAALGLSIVGLFTGGLVVLGAIWSEPASLKKPGAGMPVAK